MRVFMRGAVLRLSSDELREAEVGKCSMRTDEGLLVIAGVLVAGTARTLADAIAMPPPASETIAQSGVFIYDWNSARRLETYRDDGWIMPRGTRGRSNMMAVLGLVVTF